MSRDDIKPSIRVNTLKISKIELLERLTNKDFNIEHIPWYENGLFVQSKSLSQMLEYYLGYYYIQDSASMLPAIAMNPEEDDRILDMCAAPGSKTTQISMMINNRGLIIANDIDFKRLEALKFNLQKYGIANCIVTNLGGISIGESNLKFDKILIDAPCSGSGTFITNQKALDSWSYTKVNKLSRLQKQLLEAASKCLDENGEIIYSTCSLDPEENEEVIDHAIKKLSLVTEDIKLKGVKIRHAFSSYNYEFSPEIKRAVRIFPVDNSTEGFFICKLKKC